MMIVEAPNPQPTSATRAPSRSLASTPSNDGIHELTRFITVMGLIEPLAAAEQTGIVLMPANALARAKRLG